MHNPKFNIYNLLALTFVMWALAGLLWWVSIVHHRNVSVPIVLTIFAVCATGMYLNETK